MLSFLSGGLIPLAVFFLGGAKVPLWSRQIPVWHCQIPVWHCQIPVWHRQCSCFFGNLCMTQFLAYGYKKKSGCLRTSDFQFSLKPMGLPYLFGSYGVRCSAVSSYGSAVSSSSYFFSSGSCSFSSFSVCCFVTTTRCERYGYNGYGHQN